MNHGSVLKALVACVGVLVLAMAAGGCGRGEVRVNVVDDVKDDGPFRIAVLEFDTSIDPTETLLGGRDAHEIEAAGAIVADAVASALVNVGTLEVIEAKRLEQVMTELKLTPEDALTPENLKKLGEAAGIDGVVVGYVSDYHWWQVALTRGTNLAFTARMVNCEAGKLMWSASIHRSRYDDHSEVLFDACAAMAEDLAGQLEE